MPTLPPGSRGTLKESAGGEYTDTAKAIGAANAQFRNNNEIISK